MDSLPSSLAAFDNSISNGLITTGLMIILLWTVRLVLVRAVSRRSEILSADQRRWVQNVRSLVWVLMFFGVVLIWAPQLHTAALSLTAFVVAIVIATKEVIMCFMGAFMRVSTAPFRMGDWITIDGITGEVVDINPFSAKVQELETRHGTFAFTGKVIQIPNSRYFTFPIENLSHLKQYKMHQFTIGMQNEIVDPALLLKKLQAIVTKHTKSFQEEAAQFHKKIKRSGHIPLPDPAPRISFEAADFNNMRFTVRAYLPTKEAAAISSQIAQELVSAAVKEKNKMAKEAAA